MTKNTRHSQKAKVEQPPRIDDAAFAMMGSVPRALLVLARDERFPMRGVSSMTLSFPPGGGVGLMYTANGQTHQRFVTVEELAGPPVEPATTQSDISSGEG